MSIQVKMKNNYILIKDIEERKAEGIILPSKKWNRTARVLAAGNNKQVSKGDIIIKNVGKGTPMTINGIKMEMIHINHIILKLENNKKV